MSGSAPPAKPWERGRAGVPSTSSPSAALANALPTSQPSSSPVPAAAVPGSLAATTDITTVRPVPSRPWEQSSVTPYGSTSPYSSLSTPGYGPSTSYGASPYSSALGSSMYSSPYNRGMMGAGGMMGGYGGYSSGMYGRPGYGGGGYGSTYGSYGAGMGGYGSQYGGAYGGAGYGGAPFGGPMGMLGPPGMDPNAQVPAPPTAWQHFLAAINGLMSFVGRLSFLVDENTHAMHFFISALLQLLDRAGSLYGELARFVLRLLGRRRKGAAKAGTDGQQLLDPSGKQLVVAGPQQQQLLPGPPRVASYAALPPPGAPQWDNLWQR